MDLTFPDGRGQYPGSAAQPRPARLPWGQDFQYDEAVLNRSRAEATLAALGAGSA